MENTKKEVHLYNSDGSYCKSFESQSFMESQLGIYRGAVRDILNNRVKNPKLLISEIKAPKYPGVLPQQKSLDSPIVQKTASEKKMLLSEEDLRKKHDMYFMILSFLKSIPAGNYIDESSMLRQLSLYGKPRYREALSRQEIKDYRGKADGVIYYGSVHSIKKLKDEGVLQ